MSGYVVLVDMVVRADADEDIARIFAGPFMDAISAQEGFVSVDLLKPVEGHDYLLLIVFSEQSLQQRWVATDLHAEVWSAMEQTFSRYHVRSFHSV